MDDAIKVIKDSDDFLRNVFLVIDALSKEQKDQILQYLASQLPESVTHFEVLNKQKAVNELKKEHEVQREI